MLTFNRARTISVSRSVSRLGAAILLPAILSMAALVAMQTPVQAGTLVTGGCVGHWWGTYSCVTRWGPSNDPFIRTVPQPSSDAERSRALQRDHSWVSRCRPVIVQDRYGVPRYQYSAPGCEFGIGEY